MSISSRVQVVQRICISRACRIVPRIVGVPVQGVCFFCRLLHLFVRACVRACVTAPCSPISCWFPTISSGTLRLDARSAHWKEAFRCDLLKIPPLPFLWLRIYKKTT